nr:DUF3572 domain-containing protein [Marivivens aquimaris]
MGMKREQGETIALQALAWLASNEELMPIFMGSTGVSVDDVKNQAGQPEFLLSVLEFITMDDKWIVECCDALNVPYTTLMEARAALPGGQHMHWT